MTLVGTTYSDVTFNFPISSYCADILTTYYRLREIGPVDASLEPRQPGRWIGLNFSGGFDSVALWCLLKHELQLDFRVITSDYGGRFAHERLGFKHFARDVSCVTNLRQLGYDGRGRFNAAVPLLYADYLDLSALASGHVSGRRGQTARISSRANCPASCAVKTRTAPADCVNSLLPRHLHGRHAQYRHAGAAGGT